MEKGELTTESGPLPSGRDCVAGAVEWKGFVEELKRQWQLLWRERVDDKVRAEGVASSDFELLFVDRGTVIIATRRYKLLEFKEILEEYAAPYEVKVKSETPPPSVGGWRRFGREMAASQRRAGRSSRRAAWPIGEGSRKKGSLQRKKGGRGWLHFRAR